MHRQTKHHIICVFLRCACSRLRFFDGTCRHLQESDADEIGAALEDIIHIGDVETVLIWISFHFNEEDAFGLLLGRSDCFLGVVFSQDHGARFGNIEAVAIRTVGLTACVTAEQSRQLVAVECMDKARLRPLIAILVARRIGTLNMLLVGFH